MSRALAVRTPISSDMIDYVRAKGPIIKEAAESISITERDLELQVLLYLPRLMHGDERPYPDADTFANEIRRLIALIRNRVNPFATWRDDPLTPLTNPRDTNFVQVPEEEAHIIHERFHYLSSFRPNSLSFGLKTIKESRLASLVTLSPFDLGHVIHALPYEVNESNVLVVSRVFCFDWVPLNTVSYMMGQIYKQVRLMRPDVKMLLTYINPNLAFTGASLKASNWVFFGYEAGTRYAYIDKEYITDRELVRHYSTANPSQLQMKLQNRFEVSRIQLDPLQLYAYFIDKKLYAQHTEGFQFEFQRP
jgi:hypothetical protein